MKKIDTSYYLQIINGYKSATLQSKDNKKNVSPTVSIQKNIFQYRNIRSNSPQSNSPFVKNNNMKQINEIENKFAKLFAKSSEKKIDDIQKQSQDKLLKQINNFLGSKTVQTIKKLSPSRGRHKNSQSKDISPYKRQSKIQQNIQKSSNINEKQKSDIKFIKNQESDFMTSKTNKILKKQISIKQLKIQQKEQKTFDVKKNSNPQSNQIQQNQKKSIIKKTLKEINERRSQFFKKLHLLNKDNLVISNYENKNLINQEQQINQNQHNNQKIYTLTELQKPINKQIKVNQNETIITKQNEIKQRNYDIKTQVCKKIKIQEISKVEIFKNTISRQNINSSNLRNLRYANIDSDTEDKKQQVFEKINENDVLDIKIISTVKINKDQIFKTRDDALSNAFELIKKAETYDENEQILNDSIASSIDSKDSLIQISKKLKQEYETRISSQKISIQTHDYQILNSNNEIKLPPDLNKPQIQNVDNQYPCNNQESEMKKTIIQNNKFVKHTRVNLAEDEQENIKFPIKNFMYASSDKEEEIIIENYSLKLRNSFQKNLSITPSNQQLNKDLKPINSCKYIN